MIKIKWYWLVYLIVTTVCFTKWFSPGMLLIACVVALIILLFEQGNDKGFPVYNVYTDDDDDFEKEKDDKK